MDDLKEYLRAKQGRQQELEADAEEYKTYSDKVQELWNNQLETKVQERAMAQNTAKEKAAREAASQAFNDRVPPMRHKRTT